MIQPLSGNVKISRFTDNRLILCLLLIVLLLLTAIVDDKFDRPKVVEFYDGLKTHVVKTYENDVDSFLRSQNISLSKSDILLNSLSEILSDSMEIRLIKVNEEITTEEETINFKQFVISSNYIPQGVVYELRPGRQGLKKNYYKLTCQNSIQKSRRLLAEVVCERPVDRVILCHTGYSREAAGAPAKLMSVNVTLDHSQQARWNGWLSENGAMLGIALFPAGVISENSIVEIEGYGSFIVKNDIYKNNASQADVKAAGILPPPINVRLVMPAEISKKLSSHKRNACVRLI